MSLVAFEETLKNLLMTPEGSAALKSSEALKVFIDTAVLSPAEKNFFLSQPLERLDQYEFMVFANVVDTLESLFPFTQQLLKDQWQPLAQEYFWKYPMTSYQLIHVGEAFPEFIGNTHAIEQYPFIEELALYEWVEADLIAAVNPEYPDFKKTLIPTSPQELTELTPQLNLTALLLQLNYDISEIITFLKDHETDELPAELLTPQSKCMWIYRTLSPYRCRFFELTPLLAVWLSCVFHLHEIGETQSYSQTLDPLYEQLIKTSPGLSRTEFDHQFLQIVSQLMESQILLGSL